MFHTGYSAQAASLSATLGQPAVSILHGGARVLSAQVLSELSTLHSSSTSTVPAAAAGINPEP